MISIHKKGWTYQLDDEPLTYRKLPLFLSPKFHQTENANNFQVQAAQIGHHAFGILEDFLSRWSRWFHSGWVESFYKDFGA